MIEYYKKVVFENYANFKGRARRSEYWMFTLAQFIIFISLFILGGVLGAILGNGFAGHTVLNIGHGQSLPEKHIIRISGGKFFKKF